MRRIVLGQLKCHTGPGDGHLSPKSKKEWISHEPSREGQALGQDEIQ